MKGIAILGASGSIGTSALDVVDQHPDEFRVVGLAVGHNIERLVELLPRYEPAIVAVANVADRDRLRALLADRGLSGRFAGLEVGCGVEGAEAVASHPDVALVLTAMVGAVGLRPTLAAIERGITVAIANKEPLVAAGSLCAAAAERSGATLLPVDSEHSAIFQCLRGNRPEDVARLLLTCSGGPLRDCPAEELHRVTVERALAHPTWSMGPKITIDSATLMNKGLELIEARWLFGVPAERIDVVIHPQSVVHSMVEFVDGAVVAQLGTPDMRVPVAYALGYPARLRLDVPRIAWDEPSRLSFEPPDPERFPALGLARAALEAGGTAPAVLNAANEAAVEAFLGRRIGFGAIASIVGRTLEAHPTEPADALERILAADEWARRHAEALAAQV